VVGDKIRRLRQELKLSQQQLAGSELNRSFISLVESGKCRPSPETLRLLAQRLGKSPDFLLHDVPDDASVPVISALLESAKRDLASDRQEQWAAANEKIEQAIKCVVGTERIELEAACYSLLIRYLRKVGRHEQVVQAGERALECFKDLGDREALGRTHFAMAGSFYMLEDFVGARRHYEKAALYAAGQKSLLEFRVEVCTLLGSCLFRLGEYSEAIVRYQEAMKDCAAFDAPVRRGQLLMGLGWVFFRSGHLEVAWESTQEAAEILKRCNSPDQVLAQHNMGIIEAARGNWEQSYAILRECLRTYQARGQAVKQASVLEDLAHYWINKGDDENAATCGWEALNLLEVKDDTVLRGRVYRLLGGIATRQGKLVQARDLLRISYALLRRLGAATEAAFTMTELERVQTQLAGQHA
jgi:HTH-type transcriptional regulator, quorum sensing regulator NprR